MVIFYTFRGKIGKKIRSNIVEIYNSNDKCFTNDEVTKIGPSSTKYRISKRNTIP